MTNQVVGMAWNSRRYELYYIELSYNVRRMNIVRIFTCSVDVRIGGNELETRNECRK